MSLLSDIKFFLKKYFKNPAIITAIAYIIYKHITNRMKKEQRQESIVIVQEHDKKTLLFDDNINKYILLGHSPEEPILSSEDKNQLLTLMNNSVKIKESYGGFPMETFHKGLEQEANEHPGANPVELAQLVLDHLKGDLQYYENKN